MGRDFQVQAWNEKGWDTLKSVHGNTAQESTIVLDEPIRTREVRLLITAPVKKNAAIAEI